MTTKVCPDCEHPAHEGWCEAPSIASEGGCDCLQRPQCDAWLDLEWLLYGDEEVDDDDRFTNLPLISCALTEGHDGAHRARVDS